jgi:glycosyltransferase involved in cell wall biosynthesis
MKVSIVIAVLNSHEIVRRQILYFNSLKLPEDIEVILIDDGSEPALQIFLATNFRLRLLYTNNFMPWTQPEARNMGVRAAIGEYVICTDIDHILPRETIDTVLDTKYDVVRFKRFIGALDEHGIFTQDRNVLEQYGYSKERGLRISAHGNSYAIKRELFLRLGGSRQKDHYPNQDEAPLKRQLKRLAKQREITIIPDDDRPSIYMIPNGRYAGDKDANPFGLFHELKR